MKFVTEHWVHRCVVAHICEARRQKHRPCTCEV